MTEDYKKLNKEEAIKKIAEDDFSFIFNDLNEDVKKDRDVIKAVISKDGTGAFQDEEDADGNFAIGYLNPSLKEDKELLLLAYESDANGGLVSPEKKYVPEKFQKDEQVILSAVKAGWELGNVDKSLKNYNDIVLAAIVKDPNMFEKIDSNLKKDKKIALAATKTKENFDKLRDEFKNDQDVILEAIKNEKSFGTSDIFKKVNETLKSNKNFIIKAVKLNGNIIQQVTNNFKKDKDVFLSAVQKNGYCLYYADDNLKKDKDVVMAAISNYSSALQHADETLKKDREIVLTAIKNHTGWDYIDYLDQSFIEDKDFVIEAISLNKRFLILFRQYDEIIENLVKDVDIFNLIKEGKACGKLYSKELHQCIKYQLPEHELLCFSWSGGGDNFHGYKLRYAKKSGQQIKKINIEETKKSLIEKLLDDCHIINEMNLELGCVGEFFSDGGLVIALKPLTERFQWNVTRNLSSEFNEVGEFDSILATINLQKNYVGFSMNGENGEELEQDENDEPQYKKTAISEKLELTDGN